MEQPRFILIGGQPDRSDHPHRRRRSSLLSFAEGRSYRWIAPNLAISEYTTDHIVNEMAGVANEVVAQISAIRRPNAKGIDGGKAEVRCAMHERQKARATTGERRGRSASITSHPR
jgi:hypothetical protein